MDYVLDIFENYAVYQGRGDYEFIVAVFMQSSDAYRFIKDQTGGQYEFRVVKCFVDLDSLETQEIEEP